MHAEELLNDIVWLRRVAQRLVDDRDDAEDLVQETWLTAVKRAPEQRESWRPWLAKVLRDFARMRRRGEGRRWAREQAVPDAPASTPEEIVSRVETGRRLVDILLALDEPYRGTVLLHFHEGMALADIARAQGVPAATVRGRLKIALDRVRATLDAERGGRKRWQPSLIAFARAGRRPPVAGLGLAALAVLLGVGLSIAVVANWSAPEKRPVAARAAVPERPAPVRVVAPLPATSSRRDEQMGARARVIRGRVLSGGRPVAGAQVVLEDPASPRRAAADAEGRFAFQPERARSYLVTASAPGLTSASARADAQDPTARELLLDLQPCAAAVYGSVTDAAGGPLPATVRRNEMGGAAGPPTTADAQGRYELCVPRGSVGLSFEAAGYGATFVMVVAHARHRVDVTLTPEGTVVGVVVDEAGRPLPDARVTLVPLGWGAFSPSVAAATSDGDGHFQLDGVAAGRYQVHARAAEHVEVAPPELIVEAGRIAGPIELRLEAGARVAGVVREAGRPVAGARVGLRSLAAAMRGPVQPLAAVTQEDGSFTVAGLRRGASYEVTVRGREVVSPKAVTGGDGPVAIEVVTLGGITGRVRTAVGEPAASARISTWRGVELIGSATADAAGWFEIVGLREGSYTLRAEAADGALRATREPTVPVTRGGRTEGVDIVLDGTAAIRGVVVDGDGKPLEGVEVGVAGPVGRVADFGMSITTAEGRFELAPLAGGGEYRLTVRPFRNAWTTLSMADGGAWKAIALPDAMTRIDDVRLAVAARRARIAGTVVDAAGAPLADVWVRASPQAGDARPDLGMQTPWPAGRSDESGAFAIDVVGDGPYLLQAQVGSEVPQSVTGVAAGARDVVIRVERPGSIGGTVAGVAAESVSVHRMAAVVWSGSHSSPVSGGRFRVEGLTPGRYNVVALARDGASAQAWVMVEAGKETELALVGKAAGRVSGRVVEAEGGRGIAGITCRASPMLGSGGGMLNERLPPRAVTNGDGRFELAPLPAGTVMLWCGEADSEAAMGSNVVEVPAGGAAEVEVPAHRR